MVIYKPFNASIFIILAEVNGSMHDFNLLRPLTQSSSNWNTICKDYMHHCDPKLWVVRAHGRYFCSCTLLKYTLASCKILFRLGDCKIHRDLKCGDNVVKDE